MKSNPLVYLFGKTWQYSDGNRKNIVWYWIMFIIAESVDLFLMPLLWAKIIRILVEQGINQSSVKTLSILLGLTIIRCIFVWSLHGPARIIEQINAFKVRVNYRKYLTKGFLTLPLEWHTEHHSGDTIDKIGKGTVALHDFSEDSFVVIYALVRLLACFVMLTYVSRDYSYAVIALVVILVSAWITMRFDKLIIPNYRAINKIENQISESITDAITNISTVIILRVEKLVFDAIMRKVESPFELTKKTNSLNEWKWFCTSFCATSMRVLILGFFFWKNYGAKPGVLVATSYLLISYTNEIGDLFFQFCRMYGDIIKRKTRVMNSEELAKDFTTESFANHVLPKDWKSLQISDLTFSYHGVDSESLHLNNVSLSFRRGERIAFIGERGSGKTTFLKLMRGLYSPRELKLFVDGKIIENGFEGIHRAITLVQQDPELFAQTIEKNITMGAEYPADFIRRFTDMACFTSVVDALPDKDGLADKFQYSIKEKGINLSGGQKQCLALSRGLLACHGKDIVLLDEPTSSLDAITSITVYRNIFREFQRKTIISTVHQLDLLPLFDRICVFDKGQIVATGTLAELFETSSKFVSLWEAMKKASIETEKVVL